ncbi:cyclophilin-like fold protein [Limisalsivibrio acetivorans]|uniref:cyclophilin-like fold protein n=1 Tax=Limisalsivibrio acetivorans TaxID=1304888 RepID=UPI0003B6DFBC|nr:cyclophilin-like fold protein [Limisalsivibrio acetivorans]
MNGKILIALIIVLAAFFTTGTALSTEMRNGLPLSNMKVRITSGEHTAKFRLYDTKGAKDFYEQLPLKLELTNFRDAQWMFYPPKKLSVTAKEAYHDGKKGELSYYAPWGDVFMLYKDFYAGDNMHRLGINLAGKEVIEHMSGSITVERIEDKTDGSNNAMRISVESNGKTTVFELNGSDAALELYDQLPMDIKVEDYSNDEKIFYPPEKLSTENTPKADSKKGSLAYFAPWGDVVMFYKDFGSASGLYELGKAVSGTENIKEMSGTIRIKKGN